MSKSLAPIIKLQNSVVAHSDKVHYRKGNEVITAQSSFSVLKCHKHLFPHLKTD